MHEWARFASATMLVLAGTGIAHASAPVEVTGTYPSGDNVTLGRNQNFYLHLAYTSDTPVSIWARPYFEGKPVDAAATRRAPIPPATARHSVGFS